MPTDQAVQLLQVGSQGLSKIKKPPHKIKIQVIKKPKKTSFSIFYTYMCQN